MTFQGWIEFAGSGATPADLLTQSTFNPYQSAPVDGTIVKILTNSGLDLGTNLWSTTKYTMSDLTTSLGYLKQRKCIGWGRCRHNFAKAQMSAQAAIDFYNPAVMEGWINNWRTLMTFAAEAELAGIFFDVEPYNGNWTYNSQAQKNTFSLAQYKANVYTISREIFSYWRQISGKMQIMISDAYENYGGAKDGGTPDATNSYGLYVPFLDGLIDELHEIKSIGPTRNDQHNLIVTNALTYKQTNSTNMNRYGLAQINGTFDPALPPPNPNYLGNSLYFTDPDVISERGLMLWIDADPFNPATPNSNYFTPAVFKQQLGRINDLCEWAWIYSNAYHIKGGTVGAQYITAMHELRAERGMY